MPSFNLHTKYGALNSKPVFEAFETGAKRLGYKVYHNSNKGDVNVIWSICFSGRMAPNRRIYENFRKPIVVLEVGALRRGELWKMGVGGINYGCFYQPADPNDCKRTNKLGLRLQELTRNEDGPIVIACQNGNSGQWNGGPAEQYTHIKLTLQTLRKYTDRRIVVREHPRYPLKLKELPHSTSIQKPNRIPNTYDDYDFDIRNAFAVISHSSNPGTLASIEGVQVYTSNRSLAWPVSQIDLKDIELEPIYYNRESWLNDIAHTEWTVKEIATGTPIFLLTDLIEPAIIY